jgi:GMP synthase (glutamine-hydrolysing)
MSHGDQLSDLPPGFHVIGRTPTAPFTAIAHDSKPFYGIQFHPEVTHTPKGKDIIGRFILDICGCQSNWTMVGRSTVGDCLSEAHELFFFRKSLSVQRYPKFARFVVLKVVLSALSAVVSTVPLPRNSCMKPSVIGQFCGFFLFVMIVSNANSFHAVMVDNGVLRLNEAKQVYQMLNEDLGVNLTVVDASELFLSRLQGVEDPEQKRKIIGNTFINVFEEEASKLDALAEEEERRGGEAKGKIEWLLQGTLYPDVIESISFKGPSATIKTHHNVGGLLAEMKLKLIEPLRELFKGVDSQHD